MDKDWKKLYGGKQRFYLRCNLSFTSTLHIIYFYFHYAVYTSRNGHLLHKYA